MSKTGEKEFEDLVAGGVRDVMAAYEVLKEAMTELDVISDKLDKVQTAEELDAFMEERCKVNTLAFTLVTLVGPLREISGGMKPKHAVAMFEAAELCEQNADLMGRRIALGQLMERLGREKLVEQLVEIASARKSGKLN